MSAWEHCQRTLSRESLVWVVTGAAGFIGSHLVEQLLSSGQYVRAIDDFSTGHRHNLDAVRVAVGDAAWQRFALVEGSVTDPELCARVCRDARYVLHQAALGSVPRSIKDPLRSNHANVTGFLTMIESARAAGVTRFVYASSSSVYGDSPHLPKVEDVTGAPLSPYAVTKAVDELYARVYATLHGMKLVGLRYFNVFGPRQDPHGAYAAVIPRWYAQLLRGEACTIYGDGETSRDFCYIDNVVQANLLAATVDTTTPQVFNVAVGERTSLRELHRLIVQALSEVTGREIVGEPVLSDFRTGDVRHSLADISRIRGALGYQPTVTVRDGIVRLARWSADSLT